MNEKQNLDIDRERIKRWRNVMCPDSAPDAEINEIDAVEDSIIDKAPLVDRIRALISRIDPLSHYKAFDNVDFILDAIGQMDYPRSPAVDVLWRQGQIDDQRRMLAMAYIWGMNAWLSGLTLAEAKSQQSDNSVVLEKVYSTLGEVDSQKRWLAMCLRKTLKEHAYTPWDFIKECDDERFVRAVYAAVLHRLPSPDDLAFRLEELQNGKDRESFFQEIFSAEEHKMSHLYGLANQLKQGD
jgi:hypothetical protein